ncbi:hypothetical protein PUN28_001253 [Cardiocondyla obscurior]|uniref:Uncharacterized protein n=1 Tax=Cardiocondyla obscurior TaxID=286306 RepID=A0AAW2H4K3_9HYME
MRMSVEEYRREERGRMPTVASSPSLRIAFREEKGIREPRTHTKHARTPATHTHAHTPCKLMVQVVLLPLSSTTTLVAAAMFEPRMRCRPVARRCQPLSDALDSPPPAHRKAPSLQRLDNSTLSASFLECARIIIDRE